jgi:transcriptional regulator with PAS, ATPase and Fis domain
VRIVAATNRDLAGMAQRGELRQDLLYRRNTFVVSVPPLRERREDILPLVRHFLTHPGLSKRIAKRTSESAMQQLVPYDWPGNVRELRNIVERAIILSGNKLKIDSEHLTLAETSRVQPTGGVTSRPSPRSTGAICTCCLSATTGAAPGLRGYWGSARARSFGCWPICKVSSE